MTVPPETPAADDQAAVATTRLVLPFPYPKPDPGRRPCPDCLGKGTTGERLDFPSGAGRTLVCDVFCPTCFGCGKDDPDHTACAPTDTCSFLLADEPDDQDDGADPPCFSCQGRRWWAAQAFDESQVLTVRVPCGCTADDAGWADYDETAAQRRDQEAETLVYLAELGRLERSGARNTLSVGPFTAYALIGVIQLATRHPDMGEVVAGVLRDLGDQIAAGFFAGTPLEESIAAGWDPANDR